MVPVGQQGGSQVFQATQAYTRNLTFCPLATYNQTGLQTGG